MFHWKSWNRIPAYKFGYGWKPIFKCFLSQRIKRIDLNTAIFFLCGINSKKRFENRIATNEPYFALRYLYCGAWGHWVFQCSPVLWCVRTLSFFKVPCVCALCCGVWGLWVFSKFPCVWNSVPVLERLSFHKKSLYYIGTLPVHFYTEICSAFFDGTFSF